MIKVVRKDGETVDHLYKRFKNKSMHEGIRKEIEKRRAYMKPGDRRRAKPRSGGDGPELHLAEKRFPGDRSAAGWGGTLRRADQAAVRGRTRGGRQEGRRAR